MHQKKKEQKKEIKEQRKSLKVALLNESSHEGGDKTEASKVNEVDTVEVVKDLGYSNKINKLVLVYIFYLDILVNIDHGAMPAALSDISKDLEMATAKLGLMGSMVFFGLFIGSLSASVFFYRFSYKSIIGWSLIVNGISLGALTYKTNFILMCLSRLVTGWSQIFLTIYFPIYINCYSTQKQQSFLLSWVLVMPPLGVVIGYSITAAIILNKGMWESEFEYTWYQSFRLQTFISFGSAVIVFLLPSKYININEAVQLKREFIEQKKQQENAGEVGGTQPQINVNDTEKAPSGTGQPKDHSDESNQQNQKPKQSTWENIKSLWRNKPFRYLTLAITVLFFVVSGVQMFATFYFEHALGGEPKQAVYDFLAVAFTAPILGSVASGFITDRLGGYYDVKVLPFATIAAIIGTFVAWLIPIMNDYMLTKVWLWILLFAGAMVLPMCTGVCLTKIEPELRPLANSIANSLYMLLGNFPAPAIYGFAVWLHGREDSGWGMAFLMYYSSFMVVFMILAIVTDSVDYRKAFSKKEDDIKEAGLEHINEDRRNSSLVLNMGIPANLAINEAAENLSHNPDSHQSDNHPSVSLRDISKNVAESQVSGGRLRHGSIDKSHQNDQLNLNVGNENTQRHGSFQNDRSHL